MKFKRTILLVISCILFLCTPSPVYAEEHIFYGSGTSGAWENAWEDMKKQLPEEIREEIKDFYISDSTSIGNTKLTETEYWWYKVKSHISEFLLPAAADFSVLLGVIMLAALCKQIPLSGKLQKGLDFCCELCLAIVVYRTGYAAVENAERYIQSISAVMTAMVPVFSAVSYASGEITAATVQNTAITLFLTVITNLNNIIIRPLLEVLMALTITGAICPDIPLGNFTGSVKKFMMTLFSFILLLYSFVYSVQTSLARAADSFGLRTIRFALSNFIPVVGGPVSDAFSALRSGIGYVRSAAGIGGITVLALMVLPIGLSLWITNTVFSLSNTAAEIMGITKGSKILSDIHSILQILSALVWMVTIFFLFSIILFTKTSGQIT